MACRREVIRDHGEHFPVLGQDIHGDDRRTAGLRPVGQRAHQGRAHAPALPRIGHDYADLRNLRPRWPACVGCHSVADDRTVPGRQQGVDVITARLAAGRIAVGQAASRQTAEHGRGRHDTGEEAKVTGPQRQASEEVPDGVAIGTARLPYPDLRGPVHLSSIHELSIA
jgi:hypothetical protein